MIIDKHKYEILIIEDNPGDTELVKDFLLEHIETPHITHAVDFRCAKIKLQEAHRKFDVIFLDLSLPDKNGEALITEVVEMSRNTPVVVLTGFVDFAFSIRSLALGVEDYLLKEELTPLSLHKSMIYSMERKKSSAALEDSEKRYGKLFHLSPLPMWVVNVETLQFLDVNDAMVNHYGYSRDELLSMTLRDIRPAEEIPKLEAGIAEGSLSPGTLTKNVMIHRMKNGTLRDVELKISSVKFQGTTANVVIGTDITERLNYINAIEQQNEKLKEIAWMHSHVVRAPVARIMGLIQLMSDTGNDDAEKEQILDYILLSANELDLIIRDISSKTDIVEC